MRLDLPIPVAILALPLLVTPTATLAQGGVSATIIGTVVDSAAAPISGASVLLEDSATGLRSATVTDSEGRFTLANLRPGGPYTLTVTQMGWAPLQRREIRLRPGETLRVRLVLTKRPIMVDGIEVAVAAADPTFSATSTGAMTHVEAAMISSLPVVERNIVELASLSPMVRAEDGRISIAGQNERFNRMQVEGAILQDVFGLSPTGVPGGEAGAKPLPLLALEQYQVAVAPFDVRQSGFTGGVLNAVTRSGSNEWRGSAFGTFRDRHLLGDLTLDGREFPIEDFGRTQVGFSLGGPLKRDRAHLFVAFETDRRRIPVGGYHLGTSDPIRVGIQPDSARRMAEALEAVFGGGVGTEGPLALENPTTNLFTRLDLQPSAAHRVVLIHNLIDAKKDIAPNREPFDEYEFSSTATRLESRTHALTLQWFSTVGGRVSNQFLVNTQHTRSRNRALSDLPLIEVDVRSDFEDGMRRRRVRAGGDLFAQRDEVEQTVFQIANDVSVPLGVNRLDAGVSVDVLHAVQDFLPGARGRYVFTSLQALDFGMPAIFERNLLKPGVDDASVSLGLVQAGGYVQHEWNVGESLMLRAGLRMDVPVLLDRPDDNPELREILGYSTSAIPERHVLLSPRLGFNWRPAFGDGLQIRGGAGILSGRPPLAWLMNAYANNGLRSAFLRCEGGRAPLLSATPADTCADGVGLEAGATPSVAVIDPEFRFPQEFRASIALDRRLPLGLAATVEGVYSRALRQIALREINLSAPVEDRRPQDGYSPVLGGRPNYGIPTLDGFTARRRDSRFGHVVLLTNDDGDFSYGVSAEVRRSFGEAIGARVSYAYARSGDRQSLLMSDAVANFGLTPTSGDPNDLPLRPSAFDQPHKVTATLAGRLPGRLGGGELSLFYIGQSGRPYSYVYAGDANGDGYPGDGLVLDATNDLLYVPAIGAQTPADISTRARIEQAIALDECLQRFRGGILPRNHCRTPWSNRLDLRLRQPVTIAGTTLRWTADVANVLNLLNDEWGRIYRTAAVVPLLALAREADGVDGLSPDDPLVFVYAGPTARDPETGLSRSTTPWVADVPASQWQIQIGVEVDF